MTSSAKLILIKLLHTGIWIFFNGVIFYLLYAVITDTLDTLAWICFGLIMGEVFTLLLFRRICPVTKLARKYSDSPKYNFDIFLPEWLARYNQQIYTVILLIILLLLVWRLLT